MTSFAGYEPTSWNSLEVINSQVAADKFNGLNRWARLANLWNRLTGRPRRSVLRAHTPNPGDHQPTGVRRSGQASVEASAELKITTGSSAR
jgi:hypothetical protein